MTILCVEILTCSESNCIIAFCKYRTPPWINLVDRDDVPLLKSYFSTKATLRPNDEQMKDTEGNMSTIYRDLQHRLPLHIRLPLRLQPQYRTRVL